MDDLVGSFKETEILHLKFLPLFIMNRLKYRMLTVSYIFKVFFFFKDRRALESGFLLPTV